MSETPSKAPRSQFRVSCLKGTLLILLVIAALFIFYKIPRSRVPIGLAQKIRCMANLRDLGSALILYASEHGEQYPPAGQWCDLLAGQYVQETGESAQRFRKTHCCPKVGDEGWGYALNLPAHPAGDPNMVLVFESNIGWNGFGGPELVVTGRHRGDGANVLFVDGHVEFVKAEKLASLKWQDAGMQLPEARDSQQENGEE